MAGGLVTGYHMALIAAFWHIVQCFDDKTEY